MTGNKESTKHGLSLSDIMNFVVIGISVIYASHGFAGSAQSLLYPINGVNVESMFK